MSQLEQEWPEEDRAYPDVSGGGVPYPPDVEEVQADDEARHRSELGDAWDGETHRGNL